MVLYVKLLEKNGKLVSALTQSTVSYGRHIDNTHSSLLHRHGSDMVVQKQDSFKDPGVTCQAYLCFQ